MIKHRCENCEHVKLISASDGFRFAGCFKKPYKGKPVWEIKTCKEKVDLEDCGNQHEYICLNENNGS